MDAELDKRLKNLQTIMETNQKAIKDAITSVHTYLLKEDSNRDYEIRKLRVESQYNERVLKDFDKIKETALKYQKLFWGTVSGLVGCVMLWLAVKAFILT